MRRQAFLHLAGVTALTLIFVAALIVLLAPSSGKPAMVRAAPEQRPLRYNTIDSDTTWGPGVITITTDVVIQNGATLTVAPGTTVVVNTWDVPTDTNPYAGGATDKVEIIIEAGGRLVADGFYTDTQLVTPTQSITFTSGILGDTPWGGIRILGEGCQQNETMTDTAAHKSVIRFANIQMAMGGIYIEESAPLVSYNFIHQIWGEWGDNGTPGTVGSGGADGTEADPIGKDGGAGGHGSDGAAGKLGYGIMITGTGCTPWVAFNTIQDVNGGGGGSGGAGGHGGGGGNGWEHFAMPGPGYDGGKGGTGGNGGVGSPGGDAVGIYVNGASPTIFANQIESILGGRGGYGGSGGHGGGGGSGSSGEANLGPNQAFPGGAGKDGGDGGDGGPPGLSGHGWGIYVGGDAAPEIRKNTIVGISSRSASGGDGGNGGSGGHGGNAGGWSSGGDCGSAAAGLAGDGGQGGDGGDGVAAVSVAGIYVANETQAQVVDNFILGVFGGNGSAGGNPGGGNTGGDGGGGISGAGGGHGGDSGRGGDGGAGGLAVGIHDLGATPEFRRNTVLSVHGGDGGNGGSAYYRKGGFGGDGGNSYCNGSGGDGGAGGNGTSNGDGGDSGDGVGILVDTTTNVENNVIYGVLGGQGGTGGLFYNPAAGDGGDGGAGGNGHDGGAGGTGGAGGDGGYAGRGGHGADGLGLLVEDSSAAPRIINNTIDRLDRGPEGVRGTPGAGGTGGTGGEIGGADGANGWEGAAAQPGTAGGTIGLHISDGAMPDVYNNIIVRTAYTTTAYYVGTFTNSVGISGTTVANLDYNDVWGWQTNYMGVSTGTHDINADPLFADIFCSDCEDFSPLPGSPCIDTASNSQAPDDDHDNVLRPQDGDLDGSAIADIGAYEIVLDNTFVIPCDASGTFATPDDLLSFGWSSGMCTTCTLTTTYTPLAYPPGPAGDLDFGNLAFAVDAVDCHGDAVSVFAPTLGLNLNYGTLPPAGMDEATMDVYQWHPLIWTWATLPVQSRDEAADTLTVTLEYPGEFALLGDLSDYAIYLPLVLRSSGN